MSADSSQPVSELLVQWKQGDQEALEALLPLVYDELRRLAHHHLQAEHPGHTLQSAALVHEAYLRLVDQEPLRLDNRAHFSIGRTFSPWHRTSCGRFWWTTHGSVAPPNAAQTA